MKILVLGGTGFIGKNFLIRLSEFPDLELTATHFKSESFMEDRIKWIKADLTLNDQVKSLGDRYDLVIQAAATTSGIQDGLNNPDYHMTDNAVMNALLLRHFSRAEISHFVFFSCTTMLQSSANPQVEEDFNPSIEMFPAYFGVGWTKVYIEKLCEFYASKFPKTKYTVVRHSNVIGPYDKYDLQKSHVFAASLIKVLKAQDSVEIWGDGKVRRDLIHVSDLIDLVLLAKQYQSSSFRIYNAGGGIFVSVNDLIAKIAQLVGKPNLKLKHNLEAPSVSFESTLNCERARLELGWEQKVNLESAILTCYEHLKSEKMF